jgi:hypothetical protein
MLLLLIAAAGGQISSTEILNGSDVATPSDYPQQMLQSGQSAFEDIRVVVAPSGKPETCEVIAEVSGQHGVVSNKAVGQLSCALMIHRGRFRPAMDADGQPTYGTYSAWISWRTEEGLSYKQPEQVDGDISVAALPKGMIDPALVDVDVAVSADGTPGACTAASKTKYASSKQVISPALAAVACSQFTSSGKLAPARSQSGQGVASVQRLVARFSTPEAAEAAIPNRK